MDIIIQTSRLIMTPISLADSPFIKSLFMDEDTREEYFLSEGIDMDFDESANFDESVKNAINALQQGRGLMLIVRLKEGTPIGFVSGELVDTVSGKMWNNAYVISRSYRQRGYATEAICAFTDYINNFPISSAYLEINESNDVSKKVAINSGYVKDYSTRYVVKEHPKLKISYRWVKHLHSKRDIFFIQAIQKFNLKDYRASELFFQKALEEDNEVGGLNTDALCYSNMGMACSKYENYTKAYQCLMKAKSLGLTNASIENELKWLRVNKGLGI